MAFITSQGVANAKGDENVLREAFSQADLVSALRLPNNLFKEDAGTEVGSDLIVLQKNEGKGEDGISTDEDLLCGSYLSNEGIPVNEYFREYPDRIIRTAEKKGTDPYGRPAMEYLHEGGVQGIARDVYERLGRDCNERLDVMRYLEDIIREKKRAAGIQTKPYVQERERSAPIREGQAETMTAEAQTTKAITEEETRHEPEREAPLLTLYDLFGFTQAERRDAQKGVARKKATRQKAAPVQKMPSEGVRPQPAEPKAAPAEDEAHIAMPAQGQTPVPEQTMTVQGAASATMQTAATERGTAARETPQAGTQVVPRPSPADEEAVYAAIDWEENPPINGFYETMMSLTSERRAQLRQEEERHATPAGEPDRKGQREETGERVYPIENAAAEDLARRVQEVEQEMRLQEAALTGEERQRRHEEEMEPRPYSRPMERFLKEGTLVWEYTAGVRYQVGVLKKVTPRGGDLPTAGPPACTEGEGAAVYPPARGLPAALCQRSGKAGRGQAVA